jgi:type II secretion system protein C
MLVEPAASQLVPAAPPAVAPQPGVPAVVDEHPLRSVSPANWRAQAPRLTAAVLAALGVVELAYIAWSLLAIPAGPAAVGAIKARPSAVHWWRLSNAHLFGVEPTPAEKAQQLALARPIDWALTAVIATGDPAKGVAIVGERGKALEVLRAGAPFEAIPGSHLYQIFNDHVVIDLRGQMQSVPLLRDRSPVPGPPAPVARASGGAEPDVMEEVAIGHPQRLQLSNESLLGSLNPEPFESNGRRSGVTVHPGLRLQRRFGLRDAEVVTAVNGVEITDAAALENALKSSGDSVVITYTRDGVAQTVNLPTGSNLPSGR